MSREEILARSYNASMFSCAARFDLSAPPMNGRLFQAPPTVGQLLPSARTADLEDDGETLDSDDDNLPSVTDLDLFKAGKVGKAKD